jgi:hypothetical protein
VDLGDYGGGMADCLRIGASACCATSGTGCVVGNLGRRKGRRARPVAAAVFAGGFGLLLGWASLACVGRRADQAGVAVLVGWADRGCKGLCVLLIYLLILFSFSISNRLDFNHLYQSMLITVVHHCLGLLIC